MTYAVDPLKLNAVPTSPVAAAVAPPASVPLFGPMPSFAFPSARYQLTMFDGALVQTDPTLDASPTVQSPLYAVTPETVAV